jgi:uncharacterized delta-60 repeat protein
MITIVKKFTLMVLLVILLIGSSGDDHLIWAQNIGEVPDFAEGKGITTLSDHSIVVIGKFIGSATFGSGEPNQTVLTSDGEDVWDIFVARYNPDGTLAWAKRAGGATADWSNGITTLTDNSIVITGSIQGTATFGQGEPKQVDLTPAGFADIFIAHYNPDGTLAWAKLAGGASYDWSFGVTARSDNKTIVTGSFQGTATFGLGEPNQTVLGSAGGDDIFIACYKPDGTLAWAKSAGGVSNEYGDVGHNITVLSDNSAVVTGWFEGSAIFGSGETSQTVLTSAGGSDIFIARYNPDGILEWAKRAGGASIYDWSFGITTLSDNSIVVTGELNESVTFGPGESNQIILTSAGEQDMFVASFNSEGLLTWVKCAGGDFSDGGSGITSLSDDSTITTGYFKGSATFGRGGPNETVLTSAGGLDIFIARSEVDGSLVWVKSVGGPSNFYVCSGISTLLDNSIVWTGGFRESATFGPGEPNETILTSCGLEDMFIARYNPDGTLAWAKSAGGE